MFLLRINFAIFLILPLISSTLSEFILDPSRFTRSRVARQYQDTKSVIVKETKPAINVGDTQEPDLEDTDLVSWLRLHSVKAGNSSDLDLKIILTSVRQMERPESSKFPKIQVYNYNFGGGDVKELLLYTDPDLERQWIVNIEELDMRQNFIVFPLGDLGFGFRKEDTFVVLRKSKSKSDPFHYIHLAYLIPRSKSKSGKGNNEVNVEWDNIKPQDFVPIPISFHEGQDDHAGHCTPRACGLIESIFGTCPIIKLGCSTLHNLPINGHDKERMEALIREKQPFIYELAKILTINQRYWRNASDEDTSDERGDDKNSEGHIAKRFSRHRRISKDRHRSRSLVDETGSELTSKKKRMVGSPQSFEKAPSSQVSYASSHYEPHSQTYQESTRKKQRDAEGHDKPSQNKNDKIKPGETIPSSLDLLMMKNDTSSGAPDTDNDHPELKGVSKPSNNEEDSYFAYILEQIRNSPPSKYTVRPLECIGCEKMGTLLSDFEDSILVTFVANNIIADIFRDNESKKNLFSPEGYDLLRENGRVPYIGYGGCDYSKKVLSHAPPSVEIDDMISYYAESLGVNCLPRLGCESQQIKNKLREMLSSRYHLLEVWPDMSIRFNKSSMLPQNLILSTNEIREFMSALIFSAYTEEFRMNAAHYKDNHYDNPDLVNRHQSHRMKFQTRVILRVIDELIHDHKQHLIKGLRFLLQILRDKYLSLVGETIAILELRETNQNKSFYKATNKNDKMQVVALKDFIVNGISAMTRSGAGSSPSFITYFNRNYKRISHLFVEYGIERPHFPEGAQTHENSVRSVGDKELEKVFGKLHAEVGSINEAQFEK